MYDQFTILNQSDTVHVTEFKVTISDTQRDQFHSQWQCQWKKKITLQHPKWNFKLTDNANDVPEMYTQKGKDHACWCPKTQVNLSDCISKRRLPSSKVLILATIDGILFLAREIQHLRLESEKVFAAFSFKSSSNSFSIELSMKKSLIISGSITHTQREDYNNPLWVSM